LILEGLSRLVKPVERFLVPQYEEAAFTSLLNFAGGDFNLEKSMTLEPMAFDKLAFLKLIFVRINF